jgi:hypothetical protein
LIWHAEIARAAFAGDHDSRYRDIDELKELHAAFHQAVSHVGTEPATKLAHLEAVLALWTDDGTFISSTGVTYHDKDTPGTASCDPDRLRCAIFTRITPRPFKITTTYR